MKALRRLTVRAAFPVRVGRSLAISSANLRWSWHPDSPRIYSNRLIPTSGRARATVTRGKMLGEVSAARLARCWPATASFLAPPRRCPRRPDRLSLTQPRWYQNTQAETVPGAPGLAGRRSATSHRSSVSPSRGSRSTRAVSASWAGDHLKAASDLGVPIIGVGLLYRSGYFSQSLSRDGWQLERYPVPRPAGPADQGRCARAPTAKARRSASRSALPERPGAARPGVDGVDVGRVPLLMLDSDVEENDAAARAGHRPPLRRRQGSPPRTGTAAGHRRRPGHPRLLRRHRGARAEGLPHQ